MKSASVRVLVLIAAAYGLSACSSNPTEPSFDLTGNWTGTIQDNKNGNGTLAVTMTQSASKVSAQAIWTPVTSGTPGVGTWQGTLSGTKFAFAFSTSFVGGACIATGPMTMDVTATTMSGSYTGFNNCSGDGNGQVALTKK